MAFLQLLHGELGDVLRDNANALGIMDFTNATCWEDALIAPDALVREINEGPIGELGAEEPSPLNCERLGGRRIRRE